MHGKCLLSVLVYTASITFVCRGRSLWQLLNTPLSDFPNFKTPCLAACGHGRVHSEGNLSRTNRRSLIIIRKKDTAECELLERYWREELSKKKESWSQETFDNHLERIDLFYTYLHDKEGMKASDLNLSVYKTHAASFSEYMNKKGEKYRTCSNYWSTAALVSRYLQSSAEPKELWLQYSQKASHAVLREARLRKQYGKLVKSRKPRQNTNRV